MTFPFGVALTVLVAVAGFVAWDATLRTRHILAVSANYGVTVDAPASESRSPTGYADGRRSFVLPPNAADTAQWIAQTQEMIATGQWRLRHVDYDNPPAGREVHWAAPLHWWLAGLAWVDHQVSGRPIGESVERAVIHSGPALFVLMLFGIGGLLLRKFSPLAATLFAVGSIAVMPFYLDFVAGYADHHGLANLCALLTALFMAAAFREENPEGIRRWLRASAVAGGCGLWISAATQAPVLVGVGLGVVVAGLLVRKSHQRPRWFDNPDVFRAWGWIGSGVSLVAWLLEYFPAHLGWRLEANHPLYAAAWVGGGEAIRAILFVFRDGWFGLNHRDRVAATVGVVLVLALPVTLAFTATKTFLVADPFLWRLHAQYIAEFQGLAKVLSRSWTWDGMALCLPALILIPAGWILLRRSTPPTLRGQLALATVPALLGWLMGWTQLRWLGLAFVLTVPLLAVLFQGERTRHSFLRVLLAGMLVLAPGLVSVVKRTMRVPDFTTDDIRNNAERDVAHWLRLRSGNARAVIAASPTVTNKLIYYGGLTGVGTLYWENLSGLKDAAELFAAPTPEEARQVATRLGVTHVVLVTWGAFETTLVRLQRGLADDAPLPTDTFVQALAGPVPPPWLQAVPFKLPAHPALEGQEVRIWEVVPEQGPVTALARAANHYLELGQFESAARLAPALAQAENDLAAMVMLAGIASRDQDREGFAAVFARVLAQLAQTPGLALDEHIHLVVVLAVGQRPQQAQAQLREAMRKVDETALRRLSPGTLNDLLALSEGLQVPLPTSQLRQLAQELVPLDQRK